MRPDHTPDRNRRSIRLKGYDYSQPGLYFVTICAQGKQCLFGRIEGTRVCLTKLGALVQKCWDEIPNHFPFVGLEAFVVMPNHIHGILGFHPRAQHAAPLQTAKAVARPVVHVIPGSLAAVVRSFKSAVSTRAHSVHDRRARSIWQRNYYERVLRNGKEFDNAARYILENPLRWEWDEENPARNCAPCL